jgi:hypothetical protein
VSGDTRAPLAAYARGCAPPSPSSAP